MLAWVALAVIAGALVAASYRRPKFAFGVAGVLLAALLGYVAWDELGQRPAAVESPVPWAEVSHLEFAPGYGGNYRMRGRLANRSGRRLGDVRLRVVMLDCGGGGECVAVGEGEARFYANVPAGQARDFVQTVYLGGARARGRAEWRVTVTAAGAGRGGG
ncbi:MAG: hypothetical protein OXU31_05800 [Gammaproteobacteria bacterium]|nr:hypothetical protein [Gammaproteobacteria bacterium]